MPENGNEEELTKRLTPETAAEGEARLIADPSNIRLRKALLNYYMRTGFHSDEALKEQARHIFWVIENAPTAEVAGSPFRNYLKRR